MTVGQVGKICILRLQEDEDLLEAIKKGAEENKVKAGILMVIGALKNVVLGFYVEGEYRYVRLDEPLEIASCTGNIAVGESGETMIHAHVVVSNEKGEAFGGHLMKDTHVGITAELMIIEGLGMDVYRVFDEKAKLNLLRLD